MRTIPLAILMTLSTLMVTTGLSFAKQVLPSGSLTKGHVAKQVLPYRSLTKGHVVKKPGPCDKSGCSR